MKKPGNSKVIKDKRSGEILQLREISWKSNRDMLESEINQRITFPDSHIQFIKQYQENKQNNCFQVVLEHHELNLAKEIEERQQQSVYFQHHEIHNIFKSVREGLFHLHRLGRSHSSLNLQNLLLDQNGSIKLRQPLVCCKEQGQDLMQLKLIVMKCCLLVTSKASLPTLCKLLPSIRRRYSEQMQQFLASLLAKTKLDQLLQLQEDFFELNALQFASASVTPQVGRQSSQLYRAIRSSLSNIQNGIVQHCKRFSLLPQRVPFKLQIIQPNSSQFFSPHIRHLTESSSLPYELPDPDTSRSDYTDASLWAIIREETAKIQQRRKQTSASYVTQGSTVIV